MDESELRERLRALEERVARLEAERSTVVPSAAPPTPMPAPVPREPAAPAMPPPLPPSVAAAPPAPPRPLRPPRVPTAPPPPRDYERLFGLAVLSRVGIGILLLAGAFFGQLGWTHLGPVARTFAVYTFGVLLLLAGHWLRPRVVTRYVATLWGGGVAFTYLGAVLGHLHYGLLPEMVALGSLLASCALGQWLARRLQLEAFAVVALAGGFAAPVLVGRPSPVPTAFFTLLLGLHAWAAWTEFRWRWWKARLLAVAATVVLVIAWYGKQGPVSTWSFAAHTIAVWLGLAAPELLAALQRRDSAMRAIAAGVLLTIVLLAVSAVADGQRELPALPVVIAALAGIGGAALRPRAVALGTWIARAGAIALPLAMMPWVRDWTEPPGAPQVHVVALAAVAIALLATWRWTGTGHLGTAIAGLLMFLALGGRRADFGALADSRLLAVPATLPFLLLLRFGHRRPARASGLLLAAYAAYVWLAGDARFDNDESQWLSVALAAASGVGALGAVVAAHTRDRVLAWLVAFVQIAIGIVWFAAATAATGPAAAATMPLWNLRTGALATVVAATLIARSRLNDDDVAPRAVLGATALLGCYVAGLLEMLDAAADWTFGPREVATSLYTLTFAALLLVAGFRRQQAAMRWTALVVFAGVVVKILAYDLREAETVVRMLATGIAGAVLLIASWAYARRVRSSA